MANSWFKLQLDLAAKITPRVLAQLLMDAKAALGRYPRVRCAVHNDNQGQRTETRVALLWQIWRSRRKTTEIWDVEEWVPYTCDIDEVLDSVIDFATEQSLYADAERKTFLFAGNIWESSPEAVLNLEPATEQPVEELELFAWPRAA